eukprot:m.61219 g.61219  ORF g.61219 m.61219 type:complete len:114 (+) comp11850_c0_seq2:955-1296(+)
MAPKSKTFVVDLALSGEQSVIDAAELAKFFQERIKINGKTGRVAEGVVTSEGNKISVTVDFPMSKRYLKYLTKKFLKKRELRDWLRVVSTNPSTYELRYFNIEDAEAAEGDEE